MSYTKEITVWTEAEVIANLPKLIEAFNAATGQEFDPTLKQAKAFAEALSKAKIIIGEPAPEPFMGGMYGDK